MSTPWENALHNLDYRAKEGKTARYLIDAAESTIADLQDALDLATTQHHEALTAAENQVEEERQRTKTARAERDQARAELDERKKADPEASVEGQTVSYTYRPHESHGGRTLGAYAKSAGGVEIPRTGLWRLDELESAITHLRVAGAEDLTVVKISDGTLRAKISADGTPPQGWVPPRHEPEARKKTRLPHLIPGLTAAGGLIALGSLLAAVLGGIIAAASGVL